MISELLTLIDILPKYIAYIYPGFITIWLYCFFRGNAFSIKKYIIILSIGISFIYIIFTEYILVPFSNKKLNIHYINSNVMDIHFNGILLFLSIAVPYLINLLVRWDKIDNLLEKMYIQTSVYENEFDKLQNDYTNAIFITVYIKNTNLAYSGYAKQREMDATSRRFICLWKYRKFEVKKNNTLKLLVDHTDDNKERVIIYYDDISHFEVANIDK